MPTPAVLRHEGTLRYETAWALQHRLVRECVAGERADTLLLLEHPSVYTVGRRGAGEWRDGGDIPVVPVERGGAVTYHGPGQLIGYPIVKLRRFARGPKAFVHRLEEVLIGALRDFDIDGIRVMGRPGIWTGDVDPRKIASLGLRIVDGVTMHGFALNVTVDLAPFSRIVPCALPDCRMTSMAEILHRDVSIAAVRDAVAARFAAVFDLAWMPEAAVVEAV